MLRIMYLGTRYPGNVTCFRKKGFDNEFKEKNKCPFTIIEPAHDKTFKMACAPSEDSDQPGHPRSLISLRCPDEESLGP